MIEYQNKRSCSLAPSAFSASLVLKNDLSSSGMMVLQRREKGTPLKYDDALIDQIRDAADIVDIIGSHLNLQKKGSSFIALCPFHNDTKPSLNIHPQKQIYKCFSCGAGGDVYTFLIEYENKTFPEAVQFLAQKHGIALPKENYQNLRQRDQDIYLKDINDLAKQIYHQYLFKHKGAKAARDYLNRRGLGKASCLRFQIGYAPPKYQFIYNFFKNKKEYSLEQLLKTGLFYHKENKPPVDFFRGRLLFPIHNERNETVGFGGRILDQGEPSPSTGSGTGGEPSAHKQPKYLNSPETVLFKKSSLLYGFNLAYSQILKSKEVFVVEGYLDVIACQNHDLPAVAPLGTALTPEQIKKLKRYAQNLYLIFDGDKAGRGAALRAALLLMEAGADGEVVLLPDNLDPFDYLKKKSRADFRSLVEKSKINIYDFFVKEKIPQTDLSPAQKRDVAADIITSLRNVSEDIILSSLKEKIAQQLGIKDVDKFVSLFTRLRKRPSNLPARSRGPGASPPRKKNKMEMDFVLFLCNAPDIIAKASAILFPEDFEDARATFIYQKLLTLRKKKDIKFHDVLELFPDKKIKDYLTAYALKAGHPQENQNSEKASQDYLCKIKMHILDHTLERLQKEIGLAEASGDFDLVVKLMEDKIGKVKEKENLALHFRS